MDNPLSLTTKADGSAIAGDLKAEWLGWHFAGETETLRYGDGRKIEVGVTHKVKCEPVLCESGLHASQTVFKALQYAPGPILFRVRLGGVIVHGDDKSCATERTYLARIDATHILREFARKCALQVVHLWDCPRIVRDYLETGDKTLTRAVSAACAANAANAVSAVSAASAAWNAAWCAASAAWNAAWCAAGAANAASAAWNAAWCAASAARAAGAAWSAAWSAQEQMLEEMVTSAIGEQS